MCSDKYIDLMQAVILTCSVWDNENILSRQSQACTSHKCIIMPIFLSYWRCRCLPLGWCIQCCHWRIACAPDGYTLLLLNRWSVEWLWPVLSAWMIESSLGFLPLMKWLIRQQTTGIKYRMLYSNVFILRRYGITLIKNDMPKMDLRILFWWFLTYKRCLILLSQKSAIVWGWCIEFVWNVEVVKYDILRVILYFCHKLWTYKCRLENKICFSFFFSIWQLMIGR